MLQDRLRLFMEYQRHSCNILARWTTPDNEQHKSCVKILIKAKTQRNIEKQLERGETWDEVTARRVLTSYRKYTDKKKELWVGVNREMETYPSSETLLADLLIQ